MFGVIFAIAAACFLWTVSPIWVPVLLGVLLAIVATPLQRRLEHRWGGHPRMLAGLITIVTLLIGVGLIGFLTFVVLGELLSFLTGPFSTYVSEGMKWLHGPRAASLLGQFGTTPDRILDAVRGYETGLVANLTGALGGLLAVMSHGLLTLIFTAITSYYVLIEGSSLATFLVRMVPLPAEETRSLIREFKDVSIGILYSVVVISLIQGAIACVGYVAFGVPRPLVWASLTAAASLLPSVGTTLVCLPVGIVLIATGHVAAGAGLLLYWQVFIVTIPDYVLRPWLMKGRLRMHSLLVFIAIFGGLEAFGLLGLVLGPLFVAMFVALVRIYDRDYRPRESSGSSGTLLAD